MTDPITPEQLDELDRLVSKLPAWVNQEWFRWMQDHGRAMIAELKGRRVLATSDGTTALTEELEFTHRRRGELVIARDKAIAERDAALREVDVQRRYIAYLTEAVKPAEALAFAHGYQLSEEDIAQGEALRAELAEFAK